MNFSGLSVLSTRKIYCRPLTPLYSTLKFRLEATQRTGKNLYRYITESQKIPNSHSMYWINHFLEVDVGCKYLKQNCISIFAKDYDSQLFVHLVWNMIAEVSAGKQWPTQEVGNHLVWYTTQHNASVTVSVLTVLPSLFIQGKPVYFPSGEEVQSCNSTVKNACNPRITASSPASSRSFLMLQKLATHPLFILAIASMTTLISIHAL